MFNAMLSKVDSIWTAINSNRKLYYYADKSNLKSPLVTDPHLCIMNNDEAIISGEIIGELLLDAQMDESWLRQWSTRKNNEFENISALFCKEAKGKTTYAKLTSVMLYIFYLSISSIVRSKIVRIEAEDDKMSF